MLFGIYYYSNLLLFLVLADIFLLITMINYKNVMPMNIVNTYLDDY
jgi:hypothetical protein